MKQKWWAQQRMFRIDMSYGIVGVVEKTALQESEN